MSHRNARLNFRGRELLVQRICEQGWAVAHAAKAQGVSRQCAHRWINRFHQEGWGGLHDRSSRPRHRPRQTPVELEARIVETRRTQRRGQDWIGPELEVPARTVCRVLRRHGMPYLRECDPLTGDVIRASKTTTVRYEREYPGELTHVDVKKIGKIPAGGGWKAHGRAMGKTAAQKKARIGYDYVHSMVDDHSRLAYSEILPDEKGPTCAGFIRRAAAYFARRGIPPDRAGHDRQPLLLPQVERRARGDGGAGRHAQAHQAPLPLAERESRAVQPHPPDRVGLPTGLHQQRPTLDCPCTLARALQH